MALTTRAGQRRRECRFSFLCAVRHFVPHSTQKREEPAGSGGSVLVVLIFLVIFCIKTTGVRKIERRGHAGTRSMTPYLILAEEN
jgi:hypothetical protein